MAAVATLMTRPTRAPHNQLNLFMPDPMLHTFFPPDSSWSIALTGCSLEVSAPNFMEGAQGISSSIASIITKISKQLSVIWSTLQSFGSTAALSGPPRIRSASSSLVMQTVLLVDNLFPPANSIRS